MPLLSANILVCETVLTEKTDMLSAIRMMDTIRVAPSNNSVHFYVVTRVMSQPEDFSQHVLKVQMTNQKICDCVRNSDIQVRLNKGSLAAFA
jgi:hypothetical protein